jgi:(S)-3,5-dihydroxyphenylglycine transaminase
LPLFEAMNFLNEVADRFPDAISFAAGRPWDAFFELSDVHRYIDVFRTHLTEKFGGDLARVRRELLQYGPAKGIINPLVAAHLANDENVVVDPAAIVVTVGFQEALLITLRALRRTGRDVLAAAVPAYMGMLGAARLVDMPVLPVRTDATRGIDLDDLDRVVRAARRRGRNVRAVYVVPDFGNPLGDSLDEASRHALLRLASDLDLLILEDNPYGLFDGDRGPLPTLKSLDRERRVVHLGSFAKTGIPGARVGYVVADQPTPPDGLLADQLAKIKSMVSVNTSPLAQAVIGGKLLAHGCSLRRANAQERQVYHDNLGLMEKGLAARFPDADRRGISWSRPGGGFFMVLQVPFAVDEAALWESAERYGVLWTPLAMFEPEAVPGDDRPSGRIRLSISYLTPDDGEAGLDRLASFVDDRTKG